MEQEPSVTNQPLTWLEQVTVLREEGHVICPLMMTPPEHWQPALCKCSAPKTRRRHSDSHPACHDDHSCLIAQDFPGEVRQECDPDPTPWKPRYTL